jgi:hypothetical protein
MAIFDASEECLTLRDKPHDHNFSLHRVILTRRSWSNRPPFPPLLLREQLTRHIYFRENGAPTVVRPTASKPFSTIFVRAAILTITVCRHSCGPRRRFFASRFHGQSSPSRIRAVRNAARSGLEFRGLVAVWAVNAPDLLPSRTRDLPDLGAQVGR